MRTAVERFWQDLRHGARGFARNPALTVICVVSIAFGTGANVAIFSMADTLLLRPLPVPMPDGIVTIGSRVPWGTVYKNFASYPDYLDIRDRARTFDGIAAVYYQPVGVAPRAGDAPRIRFATFVSHNFFSVLGLDLQLGRGFMPDEDGAGGRGTVAILGDNLWRAEFGADPAVLGRKMQVAGKEFTIVGVAPPSFTGLHPYIHDSLFIPLQLLPQLADLKRKDILEARDVRILTLKGRLRQGITLPEARAELDTLWRALQDTYPDTNANLALIAQTEFTYKYESRPLDSALLVVLTTLSVAVLCVACANVAGLLASRAPVRAREIALRLAIGASRGRLVRQLITESLAIAVAGALGGLAVAHAGLILLRQIRFPTEMIAPPVFELDGRALAFSLLVAVVSALLVGLGPAVRTTRVDLSTSLKSTDRGSAGGPRVTGRFVLVTVQVALSLVLVTLAIFTVQVFNRELTSGPGFRTTGMAKASFDPGQAGYRDQDVVPFFTRLAEEARALPGVRSVTLVSAMPLFGFQFVSIAPDGRVLPKGQTGTPVWTNSVDEHYFDTMEIPLLAGRGFAATDDGAAPRVAIINDTLARQYWPNGDALGKRVRLVEPPSVLVEIVGIAKTTTLGYPGELPQQGMYFPYRQRPRAQMTLLARSAEDSAALLRPLRELVQRVDPGVPVFDVQTMEVFYRARVTSFGEILTRLVGGMGLMGLLLTMVGLYGLVSYSVSRRTREIGIRIAVGATYTRIVRMVLRQGMAPAWVGLVTGLALSVATTRLMWRLVPFGHHVDARTYYLVMPVILAVTLLAAFLPARRAAKVDPTVALRCE